MNKLQSIKQERWIGRIEQSLDKPSFVFIGGVHGNELSGVKAIETVFKEIEEKNIPVAGNIYGLRGNLQAIAAGKRFIDRDLNRVWNKENLLSLIAENKLAEIAEVKELKTILDSLIENTQAPLHFMDLHTTSSFSPPFLIIDDTIRNRNMANALPVTKVLGIIEKLKGTILGYYGDKGPVSIVFEAGQHDEQSSLDRHIAAIWLSLVEAGIIDAIDIEFQKHVNVLRTASQPYPQIVETKVRHELEPEDHFEMVPGYSNFSLLKKGDKIADQNGIALFAEKDSMIFMPLYQKQGEDGYFIVKEISPFWTNLSAFLRKKKFDRFFHFLPGIKKDPNNAQGYIVNREIASFKSIEFLHLFGFRRTKEVNKITYMFRRPFDFKGPWD